MQDEFDLHLKWVPDEPSRTFLKDYALKHNLGLTETQNSVTIKSSGYDARNIF
jgi:hypothetical protein